MKNVTITLPEDVLSRARIEAARQSKSLSRFVAGLVEQRCPAQPADPLAALEEFLIGPGFPGISKDLPTREELYSEREDELDRRSTKGAADENVAVTLDEELAAWARREATKSNRSLSRYLGDLLTERKTKTTSDQGQSGGLRAWLEHPGWLSIEEPKMSRSELYEAFYDRPGFPGHERRRVRD